MVSFCWKINVLPNKIKNNSVSSTMFMKLTIKVVAFFLGHPVYVFFLGMMRTECKNKKKKKNLECFPRAAKWFCLPANVKKNGKVQHSYFRLQKFAKHARGFGSIVNCLLDARNVKKKKKNHAKLKTTPAIN